MVSFTGSKKLSCDDKFHDRAMNESPAVGHVAAVMIYKFVEFSTL